MVEEFDRCPIIVMDALIEIAPHALGQRKVGWLGGQSSECDVDRAKERGAGQASQIGHQIDQGRQLLLRRFVQSLRQLRRELAEQRIIGGTAGPWSPTASLTRASSRSFTAHYGPPQMTTVAPVGGADPSREH